MPGGNSARGAAGFLANMKNIGMQAGQGDLKGAATTGLKYGMGTLGTAKNVAKIGAQSGFLKSYYEAQRIATERDKLVTAMNAQKKIGNLQNNTSSDLEGNKQNAYLREELKTSLDSNKLI